MANMDEISFESVPVTDWSLKNTEEWLKSCLNRYQLDDPKLFSKIKMKGKTLLIYHDYRELNKFYAENHAQQLHEDLDVRLGRTLVMPQTSKLSRISTQRKPTLTALWNKFEKQLDDINMDFGKLLDGNRTANPYANELIIESLYALKGNGNVLPIECLISRMSNSFFKQYTPPTECGTPLQHLEYGHVKLQLPIDDAVGAFVQKFSLHGYPALAELMLEQILYLGQLGAVDTNYKSNQFPAIIIVPTSSNNKSDVKTEIFFQDEERKARHSNESVDSGYRSKNASPRVSLSDYFNPLLQFSPNDLEPIDEFPEYKQSISRQSTVSTFEDEKDEIQIERNQNSVYIEENNFVVDYATDQVADSKKVSFKYDSNLSIKFEVTATENEPKTVTNRHNLFRISIENDTTEDVGFSLRAYNLSMPGDIKVLHTSPGFNFQVLKGKTSLNGDKWVHDIELIDKLIDLSGDYIIFELVVCSLDNGSGNSLKGNRWNIQRNYIQVKCVSEKNTATEFETKKELHALVNKSMGNEKRKKCLKILLDSLYYFIYNDQEKAYKLATQLILLPDFQRPQLLIFCWLIIGTYIYQGDTLDFSKQRKLIALINAGNCIKRKLESLNINLLNNIVKFSDKSIAILQHYLERHKMKRSQSCPENLKISIPMIPIISTESPSPEPEDSAITSPEEEVCNQKSIRSASSEPSLYSLLATDSSHGNTRLKAPILKYNTTRVASDCPETLTFGDCEILCPPSKTGIEIAFGYATMDTYSSQTTIVPSVNHFATLELTNDLDSEKYSEPYKINFPIPKNISKTAILRVVYQNGRMTEDITDSIVNDFNLKSHRGSIEATGNGSYIILGVEGSPSMLMCYVANDITSVRPLYVHLWLKRVNGFANWREIWCCISCKEELLIRPPIAEAWPVSKIVLNTRYNDKIEFSLLPKREELSPSIEPEMKYEFNLTETQGVFNFVHVLNLDLVGNESIFRIQNQENKMEKEIQFGKLL